MWQISHLEQDTRLDGAVSAGQRVARLIRPGKVRDVLHGVWLGHPLHPMLVQAAIGAWLSASILDFAGGEENAARRLAAAGWPRRCPPRWRARPTGPSSTSSRCASAWSTRPATCWPSACTRPRWPARGRRPGRLLRLAGLAAAWASGLLGGHISFRLAGGANHAEDVPHLVEPGWHDLMRRADLPEGKPVRQVVGEVPVVAVRSDGEVHVLADRCSHMSGPLSDGELADGCLTCPWHGSVFRLADGSVARGPATAPQPAFEVREAGGAIQVCLPGAG